MNSTKDQTGPICHVVAVPYPGRGHINPMMNLCKLLTSQKTDILITFVVTEEWFGFIGSEVTPDNIRLATIPNVVPSELVRAADMDSFIEAIMTKMEAPFERLMDRLEPPPSLIVADTFLPWAVRVGNRRSIPAASFWPMPASFFSFFQHFHLLAENGHLPVDLLERGNERVDYIPGVSSTRLADLPFISGIFPNILHHILEDFSWVPKAQYLLFPSIYELEPQVIDPKPDNIQLATIPNVLPSEHGRANHFAAFVEAVWTKLEAPVEQLLDGLEQPVTAIVADTFLVWALRIGIRRNIPVASLWTQSPTMFSLLHHFELFKENGHSPLDVSEHGDEIIEYIPGVSTTCIADLPAQFFVDDPKAFQKPLEAVSQVVEAQYLLFSSVYELDPQAFEAIKAKFVFAIYPIGPSIPHFELSKTLTTNQNDIDYLHWLDSQPKKSVLYISMGSFLSVSKSQMDEIVAGVKSSGVKVFWVARGDTCELRDCVGDLGLVVPWCDQLRVLCHDSIGGFWSHCGWNSTLEAVYAGLPILTFPILWDQIPNGKQIVEDWRIGYRVKKKAGAELVASSEEIAELVKKFMDVESEEGKDLRERAKQLQEICRGAIANGGSSDRNLDAFLKDISQGHN